MRFNLQRETLLKPLQAITSVVERRSTLPILSNVLLVATENELAITATDLEVELVTRISLSMAEPGKITVPARKLFDICRALPEASEINFNLDNERALLKSGKIRYTLSTLSADEYPNINEIKNGITLTIPQNILKQLIAKTHFAMAVNDVRYFLMGLLLELEHDVIRTCATDGHRLALSEHPMTIDKTTQVIIPRKGVHELLKLLQDNQDNLEILIGTNHIQILFANTTFTSKLIDGKFPEYRRVIPHLSNKTALIVRKELQQALSRAAIISNEKYRGARLQFAANKLGILVTNPEHEAAEEELTIEYQGEDLDISFNISYLLDAVSAIDTERLIISLINSDSSALLQGENEQSAKYVVMPMRI